MAKIAVVGALMFVFGTVVGTGISSLLSTSDSGTVEASERGRDDRFAREREERDGERDDGDPSAPAVDAGTNVGSAAAVEAATGDEIASVVRDTVAAAAAPPRAKGDGVIEGRVTNEAGEGIRGVTVKAVLSAGRGGEATKSKLGRATGDRSLDAEIQNAVDAWQKKRAATVEATTDGNGDYRLAELGPGPWSLSAQADGYVITPRGTSANVPPGSKLSFRATAVVRVPITVFLPDGRAAKRANLEVRSTGSDGNSSDLWTSEDPELVVAPGMYTVRAILVESQLAANDFPIEAASQKTRIEAMSRGAGAPIELKLEERHGIRGRVILGEGIKMQQGTVSLQQIPAGGKPDLESLANNDQRQWIHSGSNLFEFLDLAPGNYVIGLSSGWNGPILTHAVVKVERGVVVQDLVLEEMGEIGVLDTYLVGPKGEPIACSNFLYLVENEHGSHSSWVQGIEQEPGHYWIAPDDGLREWQKDATGKRKLKLTAKSDAYGDKTVEVPHGAKEIRFEFGEAATLDVVVQGYVGSGLEGKLDVALRPVGEEQHFFSQESNLKADGTAKFGPVEVGTYDLVLESFGENRWNRRTVVKQKITLAVGSNAATLAVPAMYTLVVTLSGVAPGDESWVSIQGGDRWDNSRSKDGRVEFANLPPGEYTLHSEIGGKQARAAVKVPDQLSVTLVPKDPSAMAINIEDDEKYLKTAGFADGDLIVGFDGVEFADAATMNAAFSTLIAKKYATAIVMRGTQRLEIRVEPARLMDPAQVGGNWWPTVR